MASLITPGALCDTARDSDAWPPIPVIISPPDMAMRSALFSGVGRPSASAAFVPA